MTEELHGDVPGHTFSGVFLTTDCTDCTDEGTVRVFSYPRHPCHLWSIRVLVCVSARRLCKKIKRPGFWPGLFD